MAFNKAEMNAPWRSAALYTAIHVINSPSLLEGQPASQSHQCSHLPTQEQQAVRLCVYTLGRQRVGVTFTLLPDLHKSSAPPDSQTWYDAEPEPRRHFINSKERTGAQVIAKNMDYLRYSPSLFFCECTYS
ncbi:uncharacterized protein LOC144280794 isoform X1 [Canis aureus]